jgi:hypothetical protein
MRHMICTLALLVSASGPVLAGQTDVLLEVIQGTVLAEKDHTMVSVDSSTFLRFGDRVMVKSGSTAMLSNPERGCFISLRDVGQYIVPDMSACTTGHASTMTSDFSIIPANGYPAPPPPPGVYAVAPSGSTFGSVAMGLGFVVATGGVVAVSTLTESKEEVPVSGY